MKITVPLVRDLVTVTLGSAGMVHELFLIPAPNLTRVWVSIGLLLGPTALNAAWRTFRPAAPSTGTSTVVGQPPSPSSSPPPG